MPILSTVRQKFSRLFKEKKQPVEDEKFTLLFNLPHLALQNALSFMNFIDLIQLSRCSKKARNSVKWAIQAKSIGKNYSVLFDFINSSFLRVTISCKPQKFSICHVSTRVSGIFEDCRVLYVPTQRDMIEVSRILLELSKSFYAVHCELKNYHESLELFIECVRNYQNIEKRPPVLTYSQGVENIPLHFIFRVSNPISLLKILHKTRDDWVQFDLKNENGKRSLCVNSHLREGVENPMNYDLWSLNCDTINISYSLSTLGCIKFHLRSWTPSSETFNFIAGIGERDFSELSKAFLIRVNHDELNHPIYGLIKVSYILPRDSEMKERYLFTHGDGCTRILVMYIPKLKAG